MGLALPDISQCEFAKSVEISACGVHYIWWALLENGLAKCGLLTLAKGIRRYAHALTPNGIVEKAAIMQWFLARKLGKYETLKAEIGALRLLADQGESKGHAAENALG